MACLWCLEIYLFITENTKSIRMLLYHISFRGAVYSKYVNVQRFFFWFGNILIVLGLWDLLKRIRPPYILSLSLGWVFSFTSLSTTITKVLGGVQLVDVLLVLLHHQVPFHLQCRAHLTTWDICKYDNQQCKSMFKIFFAHLGLKSLLAKESISGLVERSRWLAGCNDQYRPAKKNRRNFWGKIGWSSFLFTCIPSITSVSGPASTSSSVSTFEPFGKYNFEPLRKWEFTEGGGRIVLSNNPIEAGLISTCSLHHSMVEVASFEVGSKVSSLTCLRSSQ